MHHTSMARPPRATSAMKEVWARSGDRLDLDGELLLWP
jgi:hypothetical protein